MPNRGARRTLSARPPRAGGVVISSGLEARFDAAVAVAREAGALARRHYENRDDLIREVKGVQDLVSVADREVEDLILGRLKDGFPGDSFLGEESGGVAAARAWVIDPIDGTINFLRGVPYWSVSIAYVVDGEIEIGVVFDPVADEMYAARRGHGASRNAEGIEVSGCTDITSAVVSVGFSYRRAVERHVDVTKRILDAHCEYRRMGSAALALAHVADGRFDGFWEEHCNSWDVLAGILLVAEAGGWVNDFLAGDGMSRGNVIQACTPGILEPLAALTGTP